MNLDFSQFPADAPCLLVDHGEGEAPTLLFGAAAEAFEGPAIEHSFSASELRKIARISEPALMETLLGCALRKDYRTIFAFLEFAQHESPGMAFERNCPVDLSVTRLALKFGEPEDQFNRVEQCTYTMILAAALTNLGKEFYGHDRALTQIQTKILNQSVALFIDRQVNPRIAANDIMMAPFNSFVTELAQGVHSSAALSKVATQYTDVNERSMDVSSADDLRTAIIRAAKFGNTSALLGLMQATDRDDRRGLLSPLPHEMEICKGHAPVQMAIAAGRFIDGMAPLVDAETLIEIRAGFLTEYLRNRCGTGLPWSEEVVEALIGDRESMRAMFTGLVPTLLADPEGKYFASSGISWRQMLVRQALITSCTPLLECALTLLHETSAAGVWMGQWHSNGFGLSPVGAVVAHNKARDGVAFAQFESAIDLLMESGLRMGLAVEVGSGGDGVIAAAQRVASTNFAVQKLRHLLKYGLGDASEVELHVIDQLLDPEDQVAWADVRRSFTARTSIESILEATTPSPG